MPFYFGCTKKSNSLWTLDGITQNLREGPWLGYKEEKDRIISEKQHSFLFSKLSKDAYKRVKVGGFRSIMVIIFFFFNLQNMIFNFFSDHNKFTGKIR